MQSLKPASYPIYGGIMKDVKEYIHTFTLNLVNVSLSVSVTYYQYWKSVILGVSAVKALLYRLVITGQCT